jgi:hypothetical protein
MATKYIIYFIESAISRRGRLMNRARLSKEVEQGKKA